MDLSAQEQEWADTAWRRFEEFRAAVDRVEADPNLPTWRTDLESVSTGDALLDMVDAITSMQELGYHAVGFFKYSKIEVQSSSELEVHILTCMVSKEAAVADSSGSVVMQLDGTGTQYRSTISRSDEYSSWLVHELSQVEPRTSC